MTGDTSVAVMPDCNGRTLLRQSTDLRIRLYGIAGLVYTLIMQSTDLTAMPHPPEASHIEITPGVCGGRPRIAGTRIRVQDVVVWHERLNWSADEISSKHPQVSLADVYAALTYYHDHRDEIDRQMEEGRKRVDDLQARHPSKLPGKLPTAE